MISFAGIVVAAKRAFVGLVAFLHIPLKKSASPEPFAAVEDATPSADALLEPNAAIHRPKGKRGVQRERIDFRGILAGIVKNKVLLACLAGALLFLFVIAVTAVIVSAPAKPIPAARPATREGAALVRLMVVPPASSLAPRMAMEREGAAAYTLDDAVRLGLDGAAVDPAELSARNDAAIEELFGAVP
jgi:hypothetical protein